jgi:hypothetical protein
MLQCTTAQNCPTHHRAAHSTQLRHHVLLLCVDTCTYNASERGIQMFQATGADWRRLLGTLRCSSPCLSRSNSTVAATEKHCADMLGGPTSNSSTPSATGSTSSHSSTTRPATYRQSAKLKQQGLAAAVAAAAADDDENTPCC